MSEPTLRQLIEGATKGEWRYSFDFQEVTTSPLGIIEGSKMVAKVGSAIKPQEQIEADGALIARCNPAVMAKVLDALELYFLFIDNPPKDETEERDLGRKLHTAMSESLALLNASVSAQEGEGGK